MQPFSADSSSLFRRDRESENGALDFHSRGLDGFTGLECHDAREFLSPRRNPFCDPSENPLPLICRNVPRRDERPHGGLDRCLRVPGCRQKSRTDHATVMRRQHIEQLTFRQPAAVKKRPIVIAAVLFA